jgi:aromatic ring-opening dioxygenase catalytic subunit (LigB family)
MTTTIHMPSLYLPHGGGPAFFMSGGMRDMFRPMEEFLANVHATLPARPAAILVASAHWEADQATFTGAERPDLIYDYFGFPPETYALTYSAPGAPALAHKAASLLGAAGIEASVDASYGWDHGVFIPLKVMFPQADIPVLAMSLKTGLDPAAHLAMGQALRPLRDEGVLILGSGMSYHNLRNFGGAAQASVQFDQWLDAALAGDAAQRSAALASWSAAPSGRAAHPREEHLLPLMVASGAGSDKPGSKIWSGEAGGSRVSAWAFD